MSMTIRRLHALDPEQLSQLSRVLVDCVEGGASVNFVWPFSEREARAFWERLVPEVQDGTRVLLVAEDAGRIVGTVNLVLSWKPNQPHRGDVTKLLVERSARRKGVARLLMQELERAAQQAGRTLLTLDTEEGGAGERLYEALGWTRLGVIPAYALGTYGGLLGATFFYKQLPTPA
jgi:GNAT superfamily N-acetyltransferase